MKRLTLFLLSIFSAILFPVAVSAQVSTGVSQLHTVLDNVYNQMIPLCANLTQVCQAVAGLGVIFYVGARVWKHMANAEPIEIYPLFRPFVLVLLIGMYPKVLGVINMILSPSVTYTANLVQNQNDAVNSLLDAQARQIITGDNSTLLMTPNPQSGTQGWDKYSQPDNSGDASTSDSGGGLWSAISSGFKFLAGGIESAFRYVFKFLLSIILQVLFFAASLCIDAIRVFHLIVLGILGPFAFAFSCYDGFHHSLQHWLARYVNTYLWLPIANILGAILAQIEVNMIQLDLTRAQTGDISLFSSTDFAYLIFMLIGVVSYTTVPSLASYIINAHGGSALAQKMGSLAGMAVNAGAAAATGGTSAIASAGAAGASAGSGASMGMNAASSAATNQYNRDKIAG